MPWEYCALSPTLQIAPVAWVNMNVFDYASKLQLGHVILHAWPMTSELEEAVKFMGPTVLNSSTAECVTLEIDIPIPATNVTVARGKPIMYPSYEQIRAFAHEMSQGATSHVSHSVLASYGGGGGGGGASILPSNSPLSPHPDF